MRKILDLKKKTDRVLYSLWLGGYVERKTIECIIGNNQYVFSLIGRMMEKKYIKSIKYQGKAYYKIQSSTGQNELNKRLDLSMETCPLKGIRNIMRDKKLIKRIGKRSRALLVCNYLGIETYNLEDSNLETINKHFGEGTFYMDSNNIKQYLGDETKGARAVGYIFAPEELYKIYCEDSSFIVYEGVEERLSYRLKSQTEIPNSIKENEIVLTSKPEDMAKIFLNKTFASENQVAYSLEGRNKYIMNLKDIELQADLLLNKSINSLNEGLSKIMYRAEGISHKKFNNHKGEKICNLIVPNIGLIKDILYVCKVQANEIKEKKIINSNIDDFVSFEVAIYEAHKKIFQKIFRDMPVRLTTFNDEQIKHLIEKGEE